MPRHFTYAVAAVFSVIVLGTLGYSVLGLGPLDALYMTVITITTVGYREVPEMTSAAKAFTIVMIAMGAGAFTFAVLSGVEVIFAQQIEGLLARRRMWKGIEKVRDHIIVCGYGSVGVHVADQLQSEGVPCVVIDTLPAKLAAARAAGFLVVEGDASEERVQLEAHIDRARAVVAAVERDADNVLVTLTAKQLNPSIDVVARVKLDENQAKLRRAGADRVIAPTTIGGRQIAHALTRPAVLEFLETSGGDYLELSMEEVHVRPNGQLIGISLRDAQLAERYDCIVGAIREKSGRWKHPTAGTELHEGDTMVVIGTDENVSKMRLDVES